MLSRLFSQMNVELQQTVIEYLRKVQRLERMESLTWICKISLFCHKISLLPVQYRHVINIMMCANLFIFFQHCSQEEDSALIVKLKNEENPKWEEARWKLPVKIVNCCPAWKSSTATGSMVRSESYLLKYKSSRFGIRTTDIEIFSVIARFNCISFGKWHQVLEACGQQYEDFFYNIKEYFSVNTPFVL